jgi:hypothetical protein
MSNQDQVPYHDGKHPISDHDYAKLHKGLACPACLGKDLDAERLCETCMTPDGEFIFRTVNCENCGASWDELYRIEGYQGLNDENGDTIGHGRSRAEELAGEFHELLLDDLVHDIKSQEATDLNNRGVVAQVQFLLDSGFTPDNIRERVKND